jgi:manganese oxidase
MISYDVLALQVPIVYTIDGDHDPDGLLYTLRAYAPMLRWLRDRWDDDDGALPKLHRRRQVAQLAVDGLDRYERLVDRLGSGPEVDRFLLADRGGERAPRAAGERDPRAAAVEQNVLATVDELVAALTELTGGTVTELDPDPAVRAAWRARWADALRGLDAELARRLAELDDPARPRGFDPDALAAAGGLPVERVRGLMLNDHRTDRRGRGTATPPYDRCNPLRPLPVVRPLVLRAARGQQIEVRFQNLVAGRHVGMHRQGSGLGGTFADGTGGEGVRFGDGAAVGRNTPTTVATGGRHTYRWRCEQEGVWPINDLGDVRGGDGRGSNVHGLFGALVVEPEGAIWRARRRARTSPACRGATARTST